MLRFLFISVAEHRLSLPSNESMLVLRLNGVVAHLRELLLIAVVGKVYCAVGILDVNIRVLSHSPVVNIW